MITVILAAGYGTRLGEAGENLPKGLIKYRETTLIDHVISGLKEMMIKEAVVVTNDKYFDQYYKWAEKQSMKIKLINDKTTAPENRLGALGDLKYVIDQLGLINESVLVLPSDTYFEFSLATFYACCNKFPENFAVVVKKMPADIIKNRFACARVDENTMVVECVEKPSEPLWEYGAQPFYYYPGKVLELLPQYANERQSMDAPGSIIPWLLNKKIPVRACVVTENTLDVGTPVEVNLLKSL